MKFMRTTAGYTKFDHRRNEDMNEFQMEPIMNYIWQYQQNRTNHMDKMTNSRFPKGAFEISPSWEKISRSTPEEMNRTTNSTSCIWA